MRLPHHLHQSPQKVHLSQESCADMLALHSFGKPLAIHTWPRFSQPPDPHNIIGQASPPGPPMCAMWKNLDREAASLPLHRPESSERLGVFPVMPTETATLEPGVSRRI